MLRIGLTGGIAAGKSVVARRLVELGAVLVDADVLARRAVDPGSTGLREIVEAFGSEVLTSGGDLDRAALGRIIFDDARARAELNAIIHPRVRSAATEIVANAEDRAIVVEDIPLLVETGQAARFHLVVVVDAPEAERVRRMVEDRGMDARDAEQRIAAQVPAAERLREADAILGNAGTAEELRAATDSLWHRRLVPFAAGLHGSAVRGSAGGAGGAGSDKPARGATNGPGDVDGDVPGFGDAPNGPDAMGTSGTSGLTRRVMARITAALPMDTSVVMGADDAGPDGQPDDVLTASLQIVCRTDDDVDAAATACATAGYLEVGSVVGPVVDPLVDPAVDPAVGPEAGPGVDLPVIASPGRAVDDRLFRGVDPATRVAVRLQRAAARS